MENSFKDKLSEHVESIFKGYKDFGLHICDIATGGGKSYTIGKLTCEFYPDHFDRIVILCVQKKLVEGINREIEERFINTKASKIKPSDKLVVENNSDVMSKAIRNGSFRELLNQMQDQIEEQKRQEYNVARIQSGYSSVLKIYEGLVKLVEAFKPNDENDYIQSQLEEGEAKLRRAIRSFFDTYKYHLEYTQQKDKVTIEYITRQFPALTKVYPQVEFRSKKVLIMTIHKAVYGIDPILTEKIQLTDFADKKKTLILFDESDQAAVAMRNAIIEQAIKNSGGNKRFAKGYNGYLQYKALIDNHAHLSNEYYGASLENSMQKALSICKSNWERTFKKTEPYKSIFLESVTKIEEYRRGVFFSGPAIKLNIAQSRDKTRSYVCYKKGARHLNLVHSDNESQLRKDYNIVVPMDKFLTLVTSNTTAVKSQLRKVIVERLEKSIEEFKKEEKAIANNSASLNSYLSYPTLEREIHTLLSRFEDPSEYQFEQQLNEFITNRKNLSIVEGNGKTKVPDNTVYAQGIQLFQEEIDERDNQHRVRLSCREIATTPEKIIVDLANSPQTSIVLCSATSSCNSVVSNFDIQYLKQSLGDKMHVLPVETIKEFDELVSNTYPADHKIDIVPIEKYEHLEIDTNRYVLPEKYRAMFSKEAQKDGQVDEWFRITRRKLSDNNDASFQLYRLYQFIEVYHWFYTHDDIHSMLYFQNRSGDKDSDQINVLSCLIDGSYKDFSELDGELPSDWKNGHIRMTKDMKEVESSILTELSSDKDAKIMFVTAYGSFKAGANMQYEIPNGLDYVEGDNWESSEEKLKKDWDAVFLQTPTNYLSTSDDGNELTFEKELYNAMLTLMMLYERGCLSKSEVAAWIYKALTNNFYFGEKQNPGIIKDKSAWAQTIVEQAVGRICRTRNKPRTTYILFDESMTPLFEKSNVDKSLTKEFRALAEYILSHPIEDQAFNDAEEIVRCNDANYAQGQLDRMRRIALRYTPHSNDDDDYDDEEDGGDDIPYGVKIHQIMNQRYKKTIIKKPVVNSLDDFEPEDKLLPYIGKCYGDWERNDHNEYCYALDKNGRICPSGKGTNYTISPSSVRLDILMKNDVIRAYFENHGYATEWKKEGLILHPQILAADYAGEIGEEAFKALLLHYTDCTEDDLVHLEGKDYECADFVIKNSDGSYKIAFDVKNMRPDVAHDDKPNDIPTTQKRELKKKRLGCELITVNILEVKEEGMDDLHEILGMITDEGTIIAAAIERINKFINR
ncbi:MAG: hypothetical protein II951_09495 [Bacteroidales bacterium]|nr:hypothetical protein [Bacteroidales bacterium]